MRGADIYANCLNLCGSFNRKKNAAREPEVISTSQLVYTFLFSRSLIDDNIIALNTLHLTHKSASSYCITKWIQKKKKFRHISA